MHMQQAKAPTWLPELLEQVAANLELLTAGKQDRRPALEAELLDLQGKTQGWLLTLGNAKLPRALREQVETEWNASVERQHEIEAQLAELDQDHRRADTLVHTEQVSSRLDRLDQVLAVNDPTRGNLELSLHIDRIICFRDDRVQLRMCKLGIMPDAVELLATPVVKSARLEDEKNSKSRARRRGKLRVLDDNEDVDLRSQAEFVADVERFAGLSEEWFWIDEFTIPQSSSWASENAETVFRRRQETRLSYAKLALEFGVTPPTIGAAIRCYLEAHPEESDIQLQRGGKRKPKFDLAKIGPEAKQLWLGGESKEKLATRYGCSPPTVDKAIAFAYRQEGLSMPTGATSRAARAAEARRRLDGGETLEEIAAAMDVSDVTARAYLRASFVAEGATMPDLRRGRPASAS